MTRTPSTREIPPLRKTTVRAVAWSLAATLVALTVIEALWARHYHPVFPWHHVPGYMGAIGFASCLGIVYLSKFAGKRLLQRPEEPEDGEPHD